MGKALVISGVNYMANSLAQLDFPSTELIPVIRFNQGFWNFLTGVWTTASNQARNCNQYFIRVVPGKQYQITFDADGVYNDIPYYDNNKNILGHWGGTDGSYTSDPIILTIPNNAYFICFNIYTAKDGTGQDLSNKILIQGLTDDAYISEVNE